MRAWKMHEKRQDFNTYLRFELPQALGAGLDAQLEGLALELDGHHLRIHTRSWRGKTSIVAYGATTLQDWAT